MNDIAKGVLIGVISSAILGGFGYIFVVKENQTKIASIEKSLETMSDDMSKSGESMIALKLFVVSAHPNKDYIPLASAKKLGALEPAEIQLLASGLSSAASGKIDTFSGQALSDLIATHGLTENDLRNYFLVAREPQVTLFR